MLQVWHNYSFDRHVFGNMGINCSGFAADTMHMARLYDASRKLQGGYSLESLSGDKQVRRWAGVWEWQCSYRSSWAARAPGCLTCTVGVRWPAVSVPAWHS